jgi:hypothetical protein
MGVRQSFYLFIYLFQQASSPNCTRTLHGKDDGKTTRLKGQDGKTNPARKLEGGDGRSQWDRDLHLMHQPIDMRGKKERLVLVQSQEEIAGADMSVLHELVCVR